MENTLGLQAFSYPCCPVTLLGSTTNVSIPCECEAKVLRLRLAAALSGRAEILDPWPFRPELIAGLFRRRVRALIAKAKDKPCADCAGLLPRSPATEATGRSLGCAPGVSFNERVAWLGRFRAGRLRCSVAASDFQFAPRALQTRVAPLHPGAAAEAELGFHARKATKSCGRVATLRHARRRSSVG